MTQRVALVTGAMGGLGTAICQELAKAGHKVVASYHPQFDNKEEWLKEMAAAGFNDFVCVAGDAAFTCGPSFEALNNVAKHARATPNFVFNQIHRDDGTECGLGNDCLTTPRLHTLFVIRHLVQIDFFLLSIFRPLYPRPGTSFPTHFFSQMSRVG